MESFLYFLLEHPANTCNFYICIFCRPKQSGMESQLRGFFVFKTVLAWQYHFPGPELGSRPCSTARERLLGPAVSSVPKTCPEARPIFCSQLCLSVLPDYRQVTQTFLKPFTHCISCLVQIHYRLLGLSNATLQTEANICVSVIKILGKKLLFTMCFCGASHQGALIYYR